MGEFKREVKLTRVASFSHTTLATPHAKCVIFTHDPRNPARKVYDPRNPCR